MCLLLTQVPILSANAHGRGAFLSQPLGWHNDQIEQVFAYGLSGRKSVVEGRDCLTGTSLSFKVRDQYAFDIDESVWLDLEFHLEEPESKVTVFFDGNDLESHSQVIEFKSEQSSALAGGRWSKQSVALQRARFANLGVEGTDFSIDADTSAKPLHTFTLCNVSLRRSYKTPTQPTGELAIAVTDENGQLTPVRLGLYDSSGRMPLPADEAIVLKNAAVGMTRITGVGSPWPVANRSVFYIDGRYHARLPVGDYELIAAKGPEYRFARRRFTVNSRQPTFLKVGMRRWVDMAAGGWYSGDDHFHYQRSDAHDDYSLQLFTRAEDLKVGNILPFDDATRVYLEPYDWQMVRPDATAPFVLVPGQEAPRTSLLGHTTLLNTQRLIRDPEHYLLYQQTFDQAHAQSGLAGFAHVIARPDLDSCYQPRGMDQSRSRRAF